MCFFFQAEDGIRDLVRSRGLGDVYKRQTDIFGGQSGKTDLQVQYDVEKNAVDLSGEEWVSRLSLIHI